MICNSVWYEPTHSLNISINYVFPLPVIPGSGKGVEIRRPRHISYAHEIHTNEGNTRAGIGVKISTVKEREDGVMVGPKEVGKVSNQCKGQ